ncbi:MAG: NAD-dependent epimerase/dehydratase family protein [Aureispira sp.]|nr:NAD-dependent epimerase/dehydratase family protein [Aureispira sp.]
MGTEKILVIGAGGQIGTVLSNALRDVYGIDNVIVSDIRQPRETVIGVFEKLNALDGDRLLAIIKKYRITQIYHLAAVLSASGEQNPRRTWDINMNSLYNVLEIARQENLHKVYYPSSIAVFGGNTPKENTPQFTVLQPQTMYGITKSAGEQVCQYYWQKYGVDVRSLRYPGLISYQSLPGGGTTDYAVDIFHKAVNNEPFECFLKEDMRLPMMYMPDAIRATLELMEAPIDSLSIRYSYNMSGMNFTPAELASEIRKHIPKLEVSYKPDFRQGIAETWISSIDDAVARKDWGWKEKYNLEAMVKDMIENLMKIKNTGRSSYNESSCL